MTQQNASLNENAPSTRSPLTDLNDILKRDMLATNALIIKRLKSDVALIPQVAQYLIAAGGKRIRPLLTLACAKICDAPMDKAYLLATAIEFIHTATLLHDDVVDESDQRRGKTAANLIFGNQTAVLVGDFLFSRAFELMVETGHIEALDVLSKTSAIITEGEIKQLTIAQKMDASLDDYFQVIHGKTAALFAAACEVGAIIADVSPDTAHKMREGLKVYGHHLGMAFQIADDVLDYRADEAALGKKLGDDFYEGKMSLPVILSVQKAMSLNNQDHLDFWRRVIEYPEQINRDGSDLSHAQNFMRDHGIYGQCLDFAQDHVGKARMALQSLPPIDGADDMVEIQKYLDQILDYSIRRLY